MLRHVKESGLDCKTKQCFARMKGRIYRCGSTHICPYCSSQHMELTAEDFLDAKGNTHLSSWVADEWCELSEMKEAIQSLKKRVKKSKQTDAYKSLKPIATWSLFYISFTPEYKVRLASVLATIGEETRPDAMGDLEKSPKASEVYDALQKISPCGFYNDERYFKSFWDLLHEKCDKDIIHRYYDATLGTKPSTLIVR